MRHFTDIHAFITGGSSGIGRALAVELAQRGAHVHLAARRAAALSDALADVQAAHADAAHSAHALDVTDLAAVQQTFESLAGRSMAPQLVINCAGVVAQQLALAESVTHAPGYFDATSPVVYRQLIEVNYLGAVNVCQAASPCLRRGGQIVNVASGVAVLPLPGYAAYVGSKCALAGFSEVLRYEMRPRGVRVSVAYPEDTDTPQLRAERASRAREIGAITALSSVMSADRAAQLVLQGVARGAFHIPLGADTAIVFRLLRPLEWAKFAIVDAILAAVRHGRARQSGAGQ